MMLPQEPLTSSRFFLPGLPTSKPVQGPQDALCPGHSVQTQGHPQPAKQEPPRPNKGESEETRQSVDPPELPRGEASPTHTQCPPVDPSCDSENLDVLFQDEDFLSSIESIMLEFIPNFYSHLNVNVNNVILNTCVSTYRGVVNLSDHNLSDGELCLLSKGLTFVDTPPPS